MNVFKVKLRKRFFWKTYKVTGTRYDKETDRMTLFFPNGSLIELAQWSRHDAVLQADWVMATKAAMEAQAGQTVSLSVEAK